MNKYELYDQALANGVDDRSYSTVRYGHVSSYSGEAIVKDKDGKLYKAKGRGTTGTAEFLDREGYIEFIPMHITSQNLQDLLDRREELRSILEKSQDMLLATQESKYVLSLGDFLKSAREAYAVLKKEIARQEQVLKE